MSARKSSALKEVAARKGIRAAIIGIFANFFLASVKGIAGVLGNSYALIADAIESASDVFGSVVVIVGIKLARKPADASHPYGHGKFEPLAATIVGLLLMAAAILIAIESIHKISHPGLPPKGFTLIVLLGVIIIKEILFRFVLDIGIHVSSTVVKTDAWHHRSDAITSAAAFVGISVSLIGGEEYQSADGFAAMIAAALIGIHSVKLIKPALLELVDTAPDPRIGDRVREVAEKVAGVLGTHKCHVRKVGFDFFVDLDVLCDPEKTIREGHDLAHQVDAAVRKAMPEVSKVLVHIEPVDDFKGRTPDHVA